MADDMCECVLTFEVRQTRRLCYMLQGGVPARRKLLGMTPPTSAVSFDPGSVARSMV